MEYNSGNIRDPFLHHRRLVPAQCAPKSDDLPVQVAFAHHVVIHQQEMPDAAPRQRFHRVASHSADAEDRHSGLP